MSALLKILSILLIILTFQLESLCQKSHDELFKKGLDSYKKSDYENAVKYFEASLEGKLKSAEAYTNLGLAYHKKGDLGRAVLNFERALRQKPGYLPAVKNLKAVRQLIDTEVKNQGTFWLFGFFKSISTMLNSSTWSILFYLLLFTGSSALLLWYLQLNDKLSFVGLRSGIIFLSLSILPFLAANTASYHEHSNSFAIVISSQVGVRTAPGLDGEDISIISSGVKVTIFEEMGDWYKVRLSNGIFGWIPAKALNKI